ncbi:hypothetical protein ALNOE001_06280 [Candidatus Methanobinarius endosymbioticus]|uniref:Uncharacterized protein n=1 Tax=Candidatus Methanobinarius endosymbioticus TaxID=2006182 RepID=A0A366MEK0_9EURY|nr:hypothetical protein ALNOE001_06280 [Candidatus Methanobinarius endosymbioticus]
MTSHEDITDEDQTVSIKPEPPESQPPITKATMKSTGMPILLIVLILLATQGI